MNRSSRWPARMLAKSRTEREIRRTNCENRLDHEDQALPIEFMSSMPAGSQLFR